MLLSTNMIKLHDTFGMKETFGVLKKAGFAGLDFNNDVPEYCSMEHDAQFYRELGECAKANGIAIGQAHAPFPSSFEDAEKTEMRFAQIVQGIRNAAYLGAPMIVVHPCTHLDYTVEGNPERLFAYNLDFYRKLIPVARECGIKIAIENIKRDSITSKPERLCKLYDTLNDPVFTICFDVGHCLLQEVDPAESIRVLGDRLVTGCTHVHDNDGVIDAHTLPYYGKVEWESVMKALADIGYEGNLNYEAAGFLKNVPRELYEDALLYMAKVGHHLIERFVYYKNN